MLSTPPKLLWQSILWLKTWIPLGLTIKREHAEENHSLIFFFFNVLHFLTLLKPFTWNMHAFSLSLPVSRCSVWACSVLCLGYFIQHSTWKLHLMDTTERLRQKKKKKNCCCLCSQPSGRVEKYSPLLNICSTAVAKLSHSQSLSNLTAWYLFLKNYALWCLFLSMTRSL